jgi:Fe-S cluster biogenesis protein NfuA
VVEDSSIKELVENEIAKIRPYLQEDGGDVEFVRFDSINGILTLRMLGECSNCPLSLMTLRAGIEKFLKKNLNSHDNILIKRVEKVN